MKYTKWTSRKWIVGATAFVTLIVLLLLDANNTLVVPNTAVYLLTAIVMAWMVTEGYLDGRNNVSAIQQTTTHTEALSVTQDKKDE